MLVGLRNAESGEDERRVRISQATIVQQVEGLLSAERVGGRDDEEGMDSIAAFARRGKGQLDVIMDAAAHVFGAQVAGLFLAEQPATLPLSLSRDERLARGQFLPSHFHLVAGRGYKPFAYYSKTSAQKVSSGVARHLSYTPSERGLTAQVLRTLSARRSPDVVHDKRWSRKGEEFLDAKLLPLVDVESPSLLNEDTSGGLTGMARTWMGVPVLLDDGDARNLYGVLSFTRFRRSQKDRDSFSERDVAVARGIASLIAVLCQQRREVARIRRIVRGLLRTFQHEGMGDLLGGVSDVLHALSEETDETSVDAGHGRQRQCTDASDHLEFVQTVFEAFATYVSDEGTWDRTRSYRLESIVDPVVKVAQLSALRLGVSIRFELPPAETMVRIDRSKTRYILYAAVRNAVRSCYQRGGDGLGVVAAITVSQDRLVINVTDDGVGVNESDLQRLFVEGYSGFGGTGIGLAIIRKFIRLSNAPGAEGFCRFEPDIATGAKFVASIPLPRKGDLNED
jgi:signal transduction histidine kinase